VRVCLQREAFSGVSEVRQRYDDRATTISDDDMDLRDGWTLQAMDFVRIEPRSTLASQRVSSFRATRSLRGETRDPRFDRYDRFCRDVIYIYTHTHARAHAYIYIYIYTDIYIYIYIYISVFVIRIR